MACVLCADLKSKARVWNVESDEMRDVTPIAQNCNQTQWKGLNIKTDIAVNVDVFNRRLVTQLPKVALDYEVVLSRYCRTRKFFFLLIYDVLKHFLILTTMVFKN